MMEIWNDGMMEAWNDEMKGKSTVYQIGELLVSKILNLQ